MRKSIVAATLAASVAVGGVAGAVVGAPGLASATETTSDAVSWVQEALAGLVSDGTITQDQADAVEAALDEARPGRGHGGHPGRGFGLGRHLDASSVADALGMTEDELRQGLADGRTIAELAAEAGVDRETVIEALLAEWRAELEDEVAAGELTREEADQRLAEVEERAHAVVDGEGPPFGHGRGRHLGWGRSPHGDRPGGWSTTTTTEA